MISNMPFIPLGVFLKLLGIVGVVTGLLIGAIYAFSIWGDVEWYKTLFIFFGYPIISAATYIVSGFVAYPVYRYLAK